MLYMTVLKCVSIGTYFDGRTVQQDPLMTARKPNNDKFVQWTLIKTNKGYAIKCISSKKYFNGRDGKTNPLKTIRWSNKW